ncbi:MAG: PIG-L family deacetylase [Acidimicrobiia bacterium]|nr:PIG-L family deacetylase [Acidimicrobiia bacterium]
MTLEAMPEDWSSALCVAAHPDDLEYGAAIAVSRWTAMGRTVRYLLVTRGEAGIDGLHPSEAGALREGEEVRGAHHVGVEEVEFLAERDGTVLYGLDLRRDLARAIRRHRPDLIVTLHFGLAWGDGAGGAANQADHRATGLAVLDAARDAGNRWVFPELLDEGLGPHKARWVAVSGSPTPSHAQRVEAADVERGVASLEAHAAYLAGLDQETDVRAFLLGGAETGGEQAGSRFAVPFELYLL